MDWSNEIYADGIGQIRFERNRVLIDFVSLQPRPGNPPVPEVVQTINLSAEGFLHSFASVRKLAEKLLDAGLLTKREYIDL